MHDRGCFQWSVVHSDIFFASHECKTNFDEMGEVIAYHTTNRKNWLHFRRNWARDEDRGGYDKHFESTSKRCCHVVSDFTHFGRLCPQGWRVHYTHAAAEASHDRVWSLAPIVISLYFRELSLRLSNRMKTLQNKDTTDMTIYQGRAITEQALYSYPLGPGKRLKLTTLFLIHAFVPMYYCSSQS